MGWGLACYDFENSAMTLSTVTPGTVTGPRLYDGFTMILLFGHFPLGF